MKRKDRALKVGWEDFLACFERRGLDSLKHFTVAANLPLIVCPPQPEGQEVESGLYSRRRMREMGIQPHRLHGWGGKGQALQDYICLGFTFPTGMIRSEAETTAILTIDREVIAWEGTCFCPTNSASQRITAEEIFAHTDLQAFENLFKRGEGSRLRYRQTEILVRDHVPLERVQDIVLPYSEAGKRAARRLARMKWGYRLRERCWSFPRVRFGDWQSLV